MNRLDKVLVEKHFVETRTKAQELIASGVVKINGKVQNKASLCVKEEDIIEIVENNVLKYVSRGGLKLEKAINEFKINMFGKTVLDIGSSTGGFTDCSLQHGAKKVVAVDVGTNVMHEKLRQDDRVELHENTNIRDLQHEHFMDIDLVVVDVSFVSLERVVEKISEEKIFVDMICLIKPQFECGKQIATKYGGVIKSKTAHNDVLNKVVKFFNKHNFFIQGLDISPIKGGDGNIEYISLFSNKKEQNITLDLKKIVNIAFGN
jgi:23S rRNA (cytidine1920-2'-O)/16S rRNA (cytidine1409-2'-O)-methyltransferase